MNAQDLKNSILQLAVQGKLVEHRAEEGTARELLEQIKLEKDQLIKNKKIKKSKNLPEITKEDIPFEIPESWEWVRLGYIVDMIMGQSPKGTDVIEGGTGIEFHQGKVCFGKDYLKISNQTTIKPTKIVEANTLLLCVRAPVGTANITERRICIGRGLCGLVGYGNIESVFLLNWIRAFKNDFIRKATGTTFIAITGEIVREQLVPLPPLAEQYRIVAKIEEIFPYIEQYDKAYMKLEILNKKFPGDMKKSILQLAMQGKLVEQRSEEGTADELYEQIIAEKAKLIKEGKIKKEKPLPEIAEDEIPFEIPDSWKWVRLGNLAWNLDAGKSPNCEKKAVIKNEWGVITTTAIQEGYFDEKQNKILPVNYNIIDSMKVCVGDILITRAGPINRTGVACKVGDINYNLILSDKTVRLNMTKDYMCHDFVVSIINSPQIRRVLIGLMSGMDKQQVNISQKKIKSLSIPLPPLAEQKRIVAKIEELLPYCDQLIK